MTKNLFKIEDRFDNLFVGHPPSLIKEGRSIQPQPIKEIKMKWK